MLFETPSSIMSEFQHPSHLSMGAYGNNYLNSYTPHNQGRFSGIPQNVQQLNPHQNGHNAALANMPNSAGASRIAKPNEVFVGNLSYFCTEADLFDLFSQYVPVEDVRIVRNDSGRRSLMFGFIIFPSPFEAIEAVKILNNHLFMGRNLKVEQSDKRQNEPAILKLPGYQVHVVFISTFPTEQIVRPTEVFLRRHLLRFGTIVDAVVKEYTVLSNRQEGYGFIGFESEASMVDAINNCAGLVFEGISITCALTSTNKKSPMLLQQQAQQNRIVNAAKNVSMNTAVPSSSAMNRVNVPQSQFPTERRRNSPPAMNPIPFAPSFQGNSPPQTSPMMSQRNSLSSNMYHSVNTVAAQRGEWEGSALSTSSRPQSTDFVHSTLQQGSERLSGNTSRANSGDYYAMSSPSSSISSNSTRPSSLQYPSGVNNGLNSANQNFVGGNNWSSDLPSGNFNHATSNNSFLINVSSHSLASNTGMDPLLNNGNNSNLFE